MYLLFCHSRPDCSDLPYPQRPSQQCRTALCARVIHRLDGLLVCNGAEGPRALS
jgi:hypothetical protein